MIISLLNQKGGCGKTTLATSVAASLAESGHRVLLLDADSQGSSLLWQAKRDLEPIFSVVGIAHDKLHLEIPALKEAYEYIIIDGCPRVSGIAKSALVASDITVIPVQPSPYDLWASEEIVRLAKEAQIYRPHFRAYFAINMKIPNTVIGRSLDAELEQFGLPAFRTHVNRKVIFPEAAAAGMTLREAEGKHSETALVIDRLTKEIIQAGIESTLGVQ
jgi:chromosome partitioning protein